MGEKCFVGETFKDAIAPSGERDGFDVAVKNGIDLEQKGTPGRLDEVTIATVPDAPGMGATAAASMGNFVGPGTTGLSGIFGRKG